MKAVKIIVAIAVIVGLIWFLYHVGQQRQFKKGLDAANAAYAAAKTVQEIDAAKQSYEALLPKAGTAAQKRVVDAGIALCEADTAYLAATAKGTIENLTKAVDLMKKATALGGDASGRLAGRIAELEPRLKADIGPSLDEMNTELTRLKALPFDQAAVDLLKLWRWRAVWRSQGAYTNDKDREAVFSEVQGILKDNYQLQFEADLAVSRKPDATDEEKASIIEDSKDFALIDADAAKALEAQYPDDFKRANEAAARLQVKTLTSGAH